MAKSLTQRLTEVQAAIEAIEGGAQEYWVGRRKVVKAELKTLYDREEQLERRIARANSGSPVRVAKIGRPRPTQR